MNDLAEQPHAREEAVFEQAIAISDEAQRNQFLHRMCGTDEGLRGRVDVLVAGHFNASGFLTKAGRDLPKLEEVGDRIGRYLLVSKVGDGGCGVVYKGEQTEPIRRIVALKLIKAGMDTASVVSRFEAERQAIAMMGHANIAKVYDAGSTPTGRPYFVMEFVEGVKITDYCTARKLPVPGKLNLFLKLCDAIQHAHQKGIIHRDLKPSNILVSEEGVPKIIDFGVAKATEGKLGGATIHTGLSQFIGTPAYMSPEQAQMSGDIDTRSDIYSLGVLLYELLAGKPPFDHAELVRGGLDEMRRIIRDVEPSRPSRIRPLDSDVDWIVMKCLEKDRSRRYESSDALASDIRRHLNDQMIVARPPSAIYRAQKFLTRNRSMCVAGAIAVAAILTGAVITTQSLFRERQVRAQLKAQLNASHQFINQVFNHVAPKIYDLAGASGAQELLGKSGIEFIEALRKSAGDDATLRLTLARLLLNASRGQTPGAGNSPGNFETGLTQAQQAFALLSTPSSAVSERERLQLMTEAKFAALGCLYGLGRFDDARNESAEVQYLYEQLARFPELKRYARNEIFGLSNNIAYSLILSGRAGEAVTNYFQQMLIPGKQLATDATFDELQVMAQTYDNFATACGFLGRFSEMQEANSAAIEIWDQLLQKQPQNARFIGGRSFSFSLRSVVLMHEAGDADSVAAVERARVEVETALATDPSNFQFKQIKATICALRSWAMSGGSRHEFLDSSERRRRLNVAKGCLQESEQINDVIRSKEVDVFITKAKVELARATQ
jgi:tetratricopeptide (TPR) repeat protein